MENKQVIPQDILDAASEYATIYDPAKDKISNACSVAAEEGYIHAQVDEDKGTNTHANKILEQNSRTIQTHTLS